MYLYYFFQSQHEKEFERVEETKYNPLEILPKPNCKPECIRDYLKFTLESNIDRYGIYSFSVLEDKNKLSEILIDMYKKLDCYQKQTEEQRKETIKYIKKYPFVRNPNIDL